MYKKCLIIVIASIPLVGHPQNILPTFKGKKKSAAEITRQLTENIQLFNSLSIMVASPEEDDDSVATTVEHLRDSLKIKIDSLTRTAEITATPLIEFYGAASVGAGTDFLSTITSSGQLNAIVNPFGNTFVGLGANLLFANSDNTVKKDSVGLNSLMFPETGKFGILATVAHKIHLFPGKTSDASNEFRNHFLIPQFSFAYRRVNIDTPSTSFKVLNYNLGIKYQVEGENSNSDKIVFSLMPYFHYFNIPDEDVSNFHKTINDTLFSAGNKNAEIKACGVKTTLQFNSFLFFFDIRRNINTKNLADSNPFKGTLVNVGFSTYFRIPLTRKNNNNE